MIAELVSGNRTGGEAGEHDLPIHLPHSGRYGRLYPPNCRRFRRENLLWEPLVVGQQIIVLKNLEQRANELFFIVVTDVVVPHRLSSPIRT